MSAYSSPSWSPLDFLLRSRCADNETICEALHAIVELANAKRGMLVVSLDGHIFRSLAIADERDETARKALQRALTLIVNQPEFNPAFLSRAFHSTLCSTVGSLRANEESNPIFVRKFCDGLPVDASVWSYGSKYPISDKEALEIGLVFAGGSRQGLIQAKDRDARLEWLITCLSASVPITVRLKDKSRRRLRLAYQSAVSKAETKIVENAGFDKSVLDCSKYFGSLVRAAAKHSSADSCHLVMFNRKSLEVVRSEGVGIDLQPKLDQLLRTKAIEFVRYKSRPLLLDSDSVQRDFFSFSAGELRESVDPDAKSFIVAPLPTRAYEACESDIDGFVLAMKNRAPGFSVREFDCVQQAASQVSRLLDQWYSVGAISLIGKITSTKPPSNNLTSSVPGFPADLCPAISDIQTYLDRAVELTDSSSGTFRLLNVGDACLVRVLASPKSRLHDDHTSIKLSGKGITAETAKRGVPIYVPDLRQSEKVLRISRRDSEAEVSLPVTVGGKVIAVLNFESKVAYAYDGWLASLKIFASSISLSLELSRRQIQQAALLDSGEVLNKLDDAHQASHSIAAAKKLITESVQVERFRENTKEIQGKLKNAAASLDAILGKAVSASPKFQRGDKISVDNLVQGSILSTMPSLARRAKMRFHAAEVNGEERNARVAISVANGVFRSLQNIVENLLLHSEGEIQITTDYAEFSATWHAVVTISANTDVLLDPELRSQIYRVVIKRKNARPKLGCFLAGCYIRAIGGDAYATIDGKEFSTVLYFPTC